MLSSLLHRTLINGASHNKDDRQPSMPKATSEIFSLVDESPDDQPGKLSSPENIDQLAEYACDLLRNKKLEVSKVRPFFWSMVETYVDRFQVYPFDVVKALFSYLELRDYPEDEIKSLVAQLETLYQKQHGRALGKTQGKSTAPALEQQSLDDEISELRDSLKYAALVGELEN